MLTAGAIKARATDLGFDLCGIAPAVSFPELRRLRSWLDNGYAGDMGFLARSAQRRMDPRKVLPAARTVIVTGTVYNVDRPHSIDMREKGRALVSRYAWGDDYHAVISGRMAALLAWMRESRPVPFEAQAYVDTGPVQEKVLARYAGLGWIGKNTCVINSRLGSWFFLSVILCSLELEHDRAAPDQCGTCTKCLDACPTQALVGPRVLDATRCIAYLTIESKGLIPSHLRPCMGSHIFGCDICQDVCPYNSASPRSLAREWQPRAGLEYPRLRGLWHTSDAELAQLVAGTPLMRPDLTGLRRNIAVAIGNAGEFESEPVLADPEGVAVPGDAPSRYDPLVQEHVAWAAARHRTKGVT